VGWSALAAAAGDVVVAGFRSALAFEMAAGPAMSVSARMAATVLLIFLMFFSPLS
jgi:hypothetical protein